jgi:hypothetical protein
MALSKVKRTWLLAGLVCVLLAALAGCEWPWDDDHDCPFRDDDDNDNVITRTFADVTTRALV